MVRAALEDVPGRSRPKKDLQSDGEIASNPRLKKIKTLDFEEKTDHQVFKRKEKNKKKRKNQEQNSDTLFCWFDSEQISSPHKVGCMVSAMI